MKDWGFAQTDPLQELAQLHQFSIKKRQTGGEVEFIITVKEFITPKEPTMHFFAQADKQLNQRHAPLHAVRLGKDHAGSALRMRPRHRSLSLRGERDRRRGA